MPSHVSRVALAFLYFHLVAGTVSTKSQTGCLTKFSTKSAKHIPTSTISETFTFHPTVKSTTTLTSTVIPPSTTVTSVATSTSTSTTTLSTITDTVTSSVTQTVSSTTTTTLTSTTTISQTATITTTGTLTIPTSAGFTPLASELAASGYTVSKKRKLVKRSFEDDAVALGPRGTSPSGKTLCAPGKGPSAYAVAVECYRFVEIFSTSTIIVTAKTQSTITAPQGTVTSTSTTTVTITSTIMPADASTTLTSSVSTTQTLTATATLTVPTTQTTTTTLAAVATTYAACANNNLVSDINGVVIGDYNFYNNIALAADETDSAYDCCVLCQQTSGCGGSLFFYDVPDNSNCGLAMPSTCAPSQPAFEISTYQGYTIEASNGQCGQADYIGAATS